MGLASWMRFWEQWEQGNRNTKLAWPFRGPWDRGYGQGRVWGSPRALSPWFGKGTLCCRQRGTTQGFELYGEGNRSRSVEARAMGEQ